MICPFLSVYVKAAGWRDPNNDDYRAGQESFRRRAANPRARRPSDFQPSTEQPLLELIPRELRSGEPSSTSPSIGQPIEIRFSAPFEKLDWLDLRGAKPSDLEAVKLALADDGRLTLTLKIPQNESEPIELPGKFSSLQRNGNQIVLGARSLLPLVNNRQVELHKVAIRAGPYRHLSTVMNVYFAAAGVGLMFFQNAYVAVASASITSICASLLGPEEPSNLRWTVFRTR